jgi:cytoskeleton protein RodZ
MSEMGLAGLRQVDAGQRTAGQLLRAERERQGLTIEQLSSIIKVAPAKIDCLETDRIDHLADANYTRALAQTVCRALRMDAAPVLRALPAAQPARLHDEHAPLNQPLPQSGVSPLFTVRGAWANAALLTRRKWFLPFCILIAAAAVWWWPAGWSFTAWQEVDATVTASEPALDPLPTSDAARTAAAPEAVAVVTPQATSGAGTSAASDPSALLSSGVTASQPTAAVAAVSSPTATASAPLTPPLAVGVAPPSVMPVGAWPLTLRATDSSWVELKEVGSGRQVFGRLVQPGETVQLTGQAPMTLVVGNAQGISLQVRGRPVDLTPHVRNNVARLELQ